MRKFNLKGTVIQRMRGIERETPKAPENEKEQVQVNTEMSAGFTSAQGQLRYAWRTDVGKLRKNNQDAVILGNGLVGVADGMGGDCFRRIEGWTASGDEGCGTGRSDP